MAEISTGARIVHKETGIVITRRTIRAGSAVYPVDNLSKFGQGQVSKYPMSWTFVLTLLGKLVMVWVVVAIVAAGASVVDDSLGALGGLMLLAIPGFGFAVILVKLHDPQHHGLLLAPNSGDRQLFVTRDLSGVAQITDVVAAILDGDESDNVRYDITISNSEVSGNLVVDSVTGSLASNTNSASDPPISVPPMRSPGARPSAPPPTS